METFRTLYDLVRDAEYIVREPFTDYHGQQFLPGELLRFRERHFLPYHGGHTLVFEPRAIYLQEDDQSDILAGLPRYLAARGSSDVPAVTAPIRFDDGAAYERFMGVWSQRVGTEFLNWLTPPHGLRWLDVGCGNGAFTERLIAHCAPGVVHGIDPSEAQLAFARTRPSTSMAEYQLGDAMALPFADDSFDVAVMPLVIFFVPDPAVGVAEMARVVRRGGLVAAYAWDMESGGFPYAALHDQMRALGLMVPAPPNPSASAMDVLHELWTKAGLVDIEQRSITVQRTFADFDDYWTTVHMAPSVGSTLRALQSEMSQHLEHVMRAALPVDAAGHITISARANAVRGVSNKPDRSLP